MLKSKEFEKLIGFDHTVFLIATIVITGISFPFIFLNDTWEGYVRIWYYNIIFGILTAGIITWGNLLIFHKKKSKIRKNNTEAIEKNFIKDISTYIIYTWVATIILAYVPSLISPEPCTLDIILRNLVGSSLFMAVMVGFYESAYYLNVLGIVKKEQEQLKRENIESQMTILKGQLKPHFMFNSFNTLTSLIAENPKTAIDYTQHLSKVYRYVLEIKDKKLVPLATEIKCSNSYLFLLKIKHGENLKVVIDESLLIQDQHIIPLSLQICIENVVKHNIISNSKPMTIHIFVNDKNQLAIRNNLQTKPDLTNSTGIGLPNIKNRYKLLIQKEVEVVQNESHFTVFLPLINIGN